MGESVFDEFVDNYEDACDRGLALSGESRDYFARARIVQTRQATSALPVARLVDFGCGLGHSTPHLTEAFAGATIVGVDSSAGAIASARRRYGNDRILFTTSFDAPELRSIDLAYSNGTFHHIPPAEREAIVRQIYGWMSPGGIFALWENNPWNPGTRLVMSRIPFDRDAQMLSYRVASRLLQSAGFEVMSASFHFYFPAWARALRPFESLLVRVPFGAQYCVFGRRPA
jgi:trans-aconitate methyltransferase